jgi:uncharacterized delta-60 repeat protein
MVFRSPFFDTKPRLETLSRISGREPNRRRRSARFAPEVLEGRVLFTLPPGSLDPSFGQGGVVAANFGSEGDGVGALQPDGKIVAADVDLVGGMPTLSVERFLPSGQPDTGFAAAQGGKATLDPSLQFDRVQAVAVINQPGQPDNGKIVVAGGWGNRTTSQSGVALARFTPDGTLDTSFGQGGVELDSHVTIGASAMSIQPDGKIVVGGMALVNSNTEQGFVERFNDDGTLDTGFVSLGIGTAPPGWSFEAINAVALDPTRGLFVAGFTAGGSDIAVAHLTAEGQLDPSFGSSGIATTAAGKHGEALYSVDGLAIDPTRGIVVGGTTTPEPSAPYYGDRAVVARFTFQGRLDPTFNNAAVEYVDFLPPSTTQQEGTQAVAVQPDGRVLVTGISVGSAGLGPFVLARLNSDGTKDPGFGAGGVVFTFLASSVTAHGLLLQPDGNIVVTGQADQFVMARYLGASGAAAPTPQPPVVGSINVPNATTQVGVAVVATAPFTYNIPTDVHTAVWHWGDGTTSNGDVTEANGQGSVTGIHVYAAAGIYPVMVTVTDQRGASGSATAIPGVIVIDPSAGSITGSGTFSGPPFDIGSSSTPTGKVAFRLSAQYVGKRPLLRGNAVFTFKSAHHTFESTSLDWFVVSGGTSWYEGTGTMNHAGSLGFLVAASPGGTGRGEIRIRLWEQTTGHVVYDTQPRSPINAAPTTPVSAGRISLKHPRRHTDRTSLQPASVQELLDLRLTISSARAGSRTGGARTATTRLHSELTSGSSGRSNPSSKGDRS